jgi:hypothetical protein
LVLFLLETGPVNRRTGPVNREVHFLFRWGAGNMSVCKRAGPVPMVTAVNRPVPNGFLTLLWSPYLYYDKWIPPVSVYIFYLTYLPLPVDHNSSPPLSSSSPSVSLPLPNGSRPGRSSADLRILDLRAVVLHGGAGRIPGLRGGGGQCREGAARGRGGPHGRSARQHEWGSSSTSRSTGRRRGGTRLVQH